MSTSNRPCYSIVGEATLDEWVTDNLPELFGSYQTRHSIPPINVLFFEFCREQYDEQQEIDDEPMDEWDVRAAEADAEDAWFTEAPYA